MIWQVVKANRGKVIEQGNQLVDTSLLTGSLTVLAVEFCKVYSKCIKNKLIVLCTLFLIAKKPVNIRKGGIYVI